MRAGGVSTRGEDTVVVFVLLLLLLAEMLRTACLQDLTGFCTTALWAYIHWQQ